MADSFKIRGSQMISNKFLASVDGGPNVVTRITRSHPKTQATKPPPTLKEAHGKQDSTSGDCGRRPPDDHRHDRGDGPDRIPQRSHPGIPEPHPPRLGAGLFD